MASNGRKENILTSWKEIAAYLDRDVRTCVRWEQRYGLPVHRLERDSKAKVFAYKDQIDAWLAERSSIGSSRPEAGERTGFPLRTALVLIGLAALAVAGYFLVIRRGGPADFHIRGSVLEIVDRRGHSLWPFDTRLPDLQPEEEYRGHFKPKRYGADYSPVWPHLLIRDINGDLRPEVLFSTQTQSEDGEGTLFCFDDHGRKLWSFAAGRALAFGGWPFRAQYRIFGFNVDDYDGDRDPEILVISHQKPDWPCQAVLLDPSGRTEGEYWNAGYFMDGAAGDIDGDGTTELVLSGVNNEYRSGCVAVFKPGRLKGCSPQTDPAFRSSELGEGQQSVYILFPKTDVHDAIRIEGDPINFFWIHPDGDGLTAVTSDTQIYYDLDRTLACRGVTLSNIFQNLHDKFLRQGKVRSGLDAGYQRKLMDSILYYEAGKWIPAPAWNAATARPENGPKKR
jgi:hypothetical protein